MSEIDTQLARQGAGARRRQRSLGIRVRDRGLSLRRRCSRARIGLRLGRCGGFAAGILTRLADGHQRIADKDRGVRSHVQPEHGPGIGGRQLDHRLVGLDLEQRLVVGDHVALGDQPLHDPSFVDPFTHIGEVENERHLLLLFFGSLSCADT